MEMDMAKFLFYPPSVRWQIDRSNTSAPLDLPRAQNIHLKSP